MKRSKWQRTKEGERNERKKSSVLTVWKEIANRFGEIGMVMPSSRSLARAMVRPLKELQTPRRVLEVGPGTGPMTKQILRHLTDADTFVICEINPIFLAQLKQILATDPNFIKHKSRIVFFEGPVQELAKSGIDTDFDFILSTLPFLNFTGREVDELFSMYEELLSDRGVLSTCEYIGLRKVNLFFSSPRQRSRMKEVDNVLRKWRNVAKTQGELRSEISLLNFPPAFAVQYKYQNGSTR